MRPSHTLSLLRPLTFALASVALLAGPSLAGTGSSPAAITSAIASNSTDAICAELERAEHLLCPSCIAKVKPLLDHDDERVRDVAAWWLARRMRSELFVEMAGRLAQPDSRLARNGADALGALKMKRGIVALGAAIENPVFDGDARAAMARAIGRIGDAEGLSPLTKALAAPEAPVRAAALAAMRDLRDVTAASLASARLDDADEKVRIQAIYTIGFARSRALPENDRDAIVGKLVDRVEHDGSAEVRKKAAWALGEIGAPASMAAAPLQKAAASDDSPLVRSLASAALGRLAP